MRCKGVSIQILRSIDWPSWGEWGVLVIANLNLAEIFHLILPRPLHPLFSWWTIGILNKTPFEGGWSAVISGWGACSASRHRVFIARVTILSHMTLVEFVFIFFQIYIFIYISTLSFLNSFCLLFSNQHTEFSVWCLMSPTWWSARTKKYQSLAKLKVNFLVTARESILTPRSRLLCSFPPRSQRPPPPLQPPPPPASFVPLSHQHLNESKTLILTSTQKEFISQSYEKPCSHYKKRTTRKLFLFDFLVNKKHKSMSYIIKIMEKSLKWLIFNSPLTACSFQDFLFSLRHETHGFLRTNGAGEGAEELVLLSSCSSLRKYKFVALIFRTELVNNWRNLWRERFLSLTAFFDDAGGARWSGPWVGGVEWRQDVVEHITAHTHAWFHNELDETCTESRSQKYS